MTTPPSGALRAARSLEPQTANMLEPRDVAQYEATCSVVEQFGQYEPDDAHYMVGNDNPFAGAMRCSSCVFFEGAGACEVVSGIIDPAGLCKLWIIPEAVLGVVDDAQDAAEVVTLASSSADRETRYVNMTGASVEWRDATGTGDGSYTLSGYAAVYDSPTTLYNGKTLRLDEQIQRGAFTRVLGESPDVHLVVNHDMSRAVARTGVAGVGGLELREDTTGLRVFARLDPADPDVQALASKMRNGVVDQMSFAFSVRNDTVTTSEDTTGRTSEMRIITEIGNLYDVSVCAQGAYPQTSVSIRSRIAAAEEDRAPQGGSDTLIAPVGEHQAIAAGTEPVGGASTAKLRAARARAQLASLRHHLPKEES